MALISTPATTGAPTSDDFARSLGAPPRGGAPSADSTLGAKALAQVAARAQAFIKHDKIVELT